MSISFKRKTEPLICDHFPPDFFDRAVIKKKFIKRPLSHFRNISEMDTQKTPEWPAHKRNNTIAKGSASVLNCAENKENVPILHTKFLNPNLMGQLKKMTNISALDINKNFSKTKILKDRDANIFKL
ncbi:unnamed protein product [Blepharisma stoltei]|uniref:Uncharacterized protein n=1 Tax=Blepharisma stoltei TaxID=1481888 RepID=A0AAU9IIR8_9CILI|nr:unnamed protein product [Blepharisma stoltei]